jgi:hypothetical protein
MWILFIRNFVAQLIPDASRQARNLEFLACGLIQFGGASARTARRRPVVVVPAVGCAIVRRTATAIEMRFLFFLSSTFGFSCCFVWFDEWVKRKNQKGQLPTVYSLIIFLCLHRIGTCLLFVCPSLSIVSGFVPQVWLDL